MATVFAYSKTEARQQAQALADIAARPVWWRKAARHGFYVDVEPTGADDEMLYLAIPNPTARLRPTYFGQVLAAYRALIERAAEVMPSEAENLRIAAGYLLDKARLSAEENRRIERVTRGEETLPLSEALFGPARLREAADAETEAFENVAVLPQSDKE